MAFKLENKTIIVTSNEPWEDIWYSKHNYAWELSKKNRVFFVNSPEKWSFSNLFFKKFQLKDISPSLTVVALNNILPNKFNFLKELNNLINSLRVKKFIKKHSKSYVLWSFTPLILFRPKLLKSELTVFLVMDLGWMNFYGGDILSKASDKIALVSEHILEEYKHINTPKLTIPHGISQEEFTLEEDKLNSIGEELKPYGKFGLFTGSVDVRLNFSLIEKMAKMFPNTNFVYVGPIRIKENHPFYHLFNGSVKNIICLGAKPYKELKYYIHHSHFCITPMDLNYPGNDISHHKTIPYLAQGKPIFSPIFKAYISMKDAMYMASDENTLKLIEHFIQNGEDSGLKEKRISLAKEYVYENVLKKIETFINE